MTGPIAQMIAARLQSCMAIACTQYLILSHWKVLPFPITSSWPTEASKPRGACPYIGPHNLQVAGWLPRLADRDLSS